MSTTNLLKNRAELEKYYINENISQMGTTARWVLPCYLSEESYSTEPISFDLTEHLKTMLDNKVWERKYSYGFNSGLQNTDKNDIEKATITVYPRFISGYVNDDRLPELIESVCGTLPKHLPVKSYKDWPYRIGCVIVETQYRKSTKLPSKNDLVGDMIPHFSEGFIMTYERQKAVSKELASFFLACLHLTFPTRTVIMSNDNPINDGFLMVQSNRRTYASKIVSNAFMHEILIETKRLSTVQSNLKAIASVWHYNLWPLQRYLKAVESDQISMDNLLDLIYSLEGLFEKNASSDFIKTMCLLLLCNNKKGAKNVKSVLDLAYRIRNDIAHGEKSYDAFDHLMLDGKQILAQEIYWRMKHLVAVMIIHAIGKLMKNKEMRNLRFTEDDLINNIYPK